MSDLRILPTNCWRDREKQTSQNTQVPYRYMVCRGALYRWWDRETVTKYRAYRQIRWLRFHASVVRTRTSHKVNNVVLLLRCLDIAAATRISFIQKFSFQYYWCIMYVGDNFLPFACLSFYSNDSTILKDNINNSAPHSRDDAPYHAIERSWFDQLWHQ